MLITSGDIVVYSRTRFEDAHEVLEVGIVKRVDYGRDVAFVAYSAGDTCAATPFDNLRSVSNGYALKALSQRAEQLGVEQWGLDRWCENWGGDR